LLLGEGLVRLGQGVALEGVEQLEFLVRERDLEAFELVVRPAGRQGDGEQNRRGI
jgi:hypothetical protein